MQIHAELRHYSSVYSKIRWKEPERQGGSRYGSAGKGNLKSLELCDCDVNDTQRASLCCHLKQHSFQGQMKPCEATSDSTGEWKLVHEPVVCHADGLCQNYVGSAACSQLLTVRKRRGGGVIKATGMHCHLLPSHGYL